MKFKEKEMGPIRIKQCLELLLILLPGLIGCTPKTQSTAEATANPNTGASEPTTNSDKPAESIVVQLEVVLNTLKQTFDSLNSYWLETITQEQIQEFEQSGKFTETIIEDGGSITIGDITLTAEEISEHDGHVYFYNLADTIYYYHYIKIEKIVDESGNEKTIVKIYQLSLELYFNHTDLQ